MFQASSFDDARTIANKQARLNKFKAWVATVEDCFMRGGYERWVQVIESTHKLWHEEQRAKQIQLPSLPKWLDLR